jgi:hypothetical protein
MARIEAVNQVGETVVKLLNDSRALRTAARALGDLPGAIPIAHISAARLATSPEPDAGLTLMLYRIEPSDHQWPQPPSREPERPSVLGLDLLYLLTAWSPNPAEEQAMMSGAMLELYRRPVLDRSVLTGANVWGPDETVQIVHETLIDDGLYRLWPALQRKYRLSTAYRARVVRLRTGPDETFLPVVEKRLGFAPADPMALPSGARHSATSGSRSASSAHSSSLTSQPTRP